MRRKILSLSLVMLLLLAFTLPGAIATTGSITLLSSDAAKNGTIYNAYLFIDPDGNLDPAFYTVLNNPAVTKTDNSQFTGEADLEEYMAEMTVAQLKEFADKVKAFINAPVLTPRTSTATMTAGSAVFAGLDAGYYLIFEDDLSEPGDAGDFVAAVELDPGADREIYLKDEHPDIEKSASLTAGSSGETSLTAAPDQTIHFTVTSKVPVIAGYSGYIFRITDTMSSNLAFGNFTSLNIGGVEIMDGTELASSNWTNIRTDGFDLTIPYTALQTYNAHDPIELKYTAALITATPPGATENNSVILEYSNNPDDWENPEPTDPEIVVVTTDPAEFTIKKTGNLTADLLGLNGAQFSLYLAPDTTVSPIFQGTTGGGGELTVTGLMPGNTYILMETIAPENYKGLKVDSGSSAERAKIEIVVDASGVITAVTHDGVYGAGDDELYGGTVTWSGNHLDITNIFEHPLLPETGGIGRTIFTISGVLMMAGAGAAISYRKKIGGKKKSR